MVIPLAIYLARHSAVRAVRTGWLVVAGLSVVTVVMTFSRGGFVGMLLLGAFYVKNSRNKLASLGLVALAGVLIYALAPDSWFDRLNTIKEAGDDGSFMGRVVAWKISWLIAMDHPLFGGGPHAVQHLLVWDTYKPLLASLDFIATPPPDSTPHAAHSIYFELLGDIGFVGLGIFLACVGVAIWNCRWIVRQTPQPSLAGLGGRPGAPVADQPGGLPGDRRRAEHGLLRAALHPGRHAVARPAHRARDAGGGGSFQRARLGNGVDRRLARARSRAGVPALARVAGRERLPGTHDISALVEPGTAKPPTAFVRARSEVSPHRLRRFTTIEGPARPRRHGRRALSCRTPPRQVAHHAPPC